jgi:hypothetical protein
MWSVPDSLVVTDVQRRMLEAWIAAGNSPPKVVLVPASSWSPRAVWRERFASGGPKALAEDASGRRRKPRISADKIRQIVEATLYSKPPAAMHWSVRTMAAAQGVSPATVQRIWDANGLERHGVKTFKLSRDKLFIEKLTDVVVLYMNPPDKALVLWVDEKSQIQALNRTEPRLPMKKGSVRHHDARLRAERNHEHSKLYSLCQPRPRQSTAVRCSVTFTKHGAGNIPRSRWLFSEATVLLG